MRIEDCKPGMRVVYCPGVGPCEEGTITSVNGSYAFVCYGLPGSTSKATPPERLEPVARAEE